MPEAEPAVFWVCGASGAGKSVAAWALFEALAAEGVRVGYVDIDQLGMLYPAAGDDPSGICSRRGRWSHWYPATPRQGRRYSSSQAW